MTGVAPVVRVLSFGYHHRPPPPANLVLDVRWMPNPFDHTDLRDLSGLDHVVQDYLFDKAGGRDWFEGLVTVLRPQLTRARSRDSSALTWAFGCAGGHDRSVAVAEIVAARFRATDDDVFVRHLDIHHRAGAQNDSPLGFVRTPVVAP